MKISEASLVTEATGGMKIPTGEVGDLAITVEQIRQYIIDRLSLGALLGTYKIDTSGIAAPVTNGDIRYNNAIQTSATVLYISHITDSDIDIDVILEFLSTSTKLIIQDKDESANYQRWEISGTPSFASSTWTIPVTFIEANGTGLAGFANNHQVILAAFTAGGTGTGGGHEIQEGGTPLPTQPALNFDATDFDLSNNVGNSSTDVALGSTHKNKLNNITVTQPVDLDAIESRVNELDAAVVLKGGWDASAGTFPAAGIAQAGWSYQVTVAGTVDGVQFSVNDRLIAIIDNASTTVYANNWLKADYSDLITSLDGQTGALTLGAVINTLTAKTTLVDGDHVPVMDSAASNASKKWSFANIKANLKSYFDGVYLLLSGGSLSGALNEAKGSDIASASSIDLGAATGNYVNVTGTTTITALGTVQAGTRRIINFTGVLILTHNATSLILPTAANITTAAGDVAVFVSLGSGNWKCVSYIRSDGTQPSLDELSNVKGVTSPLQTQINNKQATLVSGTNIKTINGNSVLGSGDLSVTANVDYPEAASTLYLLNSY